MFYQMNGSSPSAGLELSRSNQKRNVSVSNNSKLIKFLENNKTNEKYLVAVPSAMSYGSDLILQTGEPVMALGGFSGSDPILTVDQFKQLVDSGAIRYAMVSGGNGRGMGGNNSSNTITNWIKNNGQAVDGSKWRDTTVSKQQTDALKKQTENQKLGGFDDRTNSTELYDLKPKVDNQSIN